MDIQKWIRRVTNLTVACLLPSTALVVLVSMLLNGFIEESNEKFWAVQTLISGAISFILCSSIASCIHKIRAALVQKQHVIYGIQALTFLARCFSLALTLLYGTLYTVDWLTPMPTNIFVTTMMAVLSFVLPIVTAFATYVLLIEAIRLERHLASDLLERIAATS